VDDDERRPSLTNKEIVSTQGIANNGSLSGYNAFVSSHLQVFHSARQRVSSFGS